MSEVLPIEYDDKTARDLQFEELLQRIAARAMTEAGQEAILALRPLRTLEEATLAHTRLREALLMEDEGAPLPIARIAPIGEFCDGVERGRSGSARELLQAARVVDVALSLRRHVQLRKQSCPEIERLLWCSPELGTLRDAVMRAIDENAEIRDSASDGVRRGRHGLANARDKLRAAGQKLISRYKDVLSGQFVAERGGRAVLRP